MNPDKLFDYLEGRLPPGERTRLEEELARDPQLQREFAAARRIHSGMRGDSREVLLDDDPERLRQGRQMALRVGTAFIILMGLNVVVGLWVIAHKEASNPNRKLLKEQVQNQIHESAERAAAAFTPPPIGVNELTIPVNRDQLNSMADKVVKTAQDFGGSATKGLPDTDHIGVLADLPAPRATEFRGALTRLAPGLTSGSNSPNESSGDPSEKESFNIHIVVSPSP